MRSSSTSWVPTYYNPLVKPIHCLISTFSPVGRLFRTSRPNTLAWGHGYQSGSFLIIMEALLCLQIMALLGSKVENWSKLDSTWLKCAYDNTHVLDLSHVIISITFFCLIEHSTTPSTLKRMILRECVLAPTFSMESTTAISMSIQPTSIYVYRTCSIIRPPRINAPPPLRGLSYCAGFLSRKHAPPCSDPYIYKRALTRSRVRDTRYTCMRL